MMRVHAWCRAVAVARGGPWLTLGVLPAILLFAGAARGWAPDAMRDAAPLDLSRALHVVGLGARSTALVGDAGEAWRLVSSNFVHTSWSHLLFNVAFVFPVGGALEQVVRRSDYAVLLVAVMVGSGLTSLLATPQVSAGMSGVVFGLLGAAVAIGVRHHARLGPRIRHHFGLWVLPFLLVTLAITIGNPSVDHGSHLGGLLAGLVFAPWMRLRLPEPIERGSRANVLALALSGVAMLSAPAIARGGAAVRVPVDAEWTMTVPRSWSASYGPLGELQWSTASGLVVLTVGDAPSTSASASEGLEGWYLDHRLRPLADAGRRIDPAARSPASGEDAAALPHGAQHVRFDLEREGIPMVRDVYFLPGAIANEGVTAGSRALVVSLECPRWWADRYHETRRALVGSLRLQRPGAPANGVTRVSVAAIE
jgi:rhomboid protease GluP